ncbi:MAG: hemolysin family protein [Armatimonadaceae bacterium]
MSEPAQSALLLLFALFLVFLNGFFVAAEFAIVKVRATRIEELAEQGAFGAKLAKRAVEHLDAYLSATQLGITLASLGLGYIGEPAFAHLLEPLFGELDETARHFVAGAIAFTIITILHIVLGELAPKSLAIQKAEKVTLAIIHPLHWFYLLFRLPIALLNGIAGLVLKAFGLTAANEHGQDMHSQEELRIILSASHEGGAIEAEEYQLVNRVFEFGREQAKEVLVPRPDVVFLSTGKTISENIRIAEESSFTRFPLIEEGSPDNVLGMVHVKDLLALSRQMSAEPEPEQLRRIAREMLRIPETKAIDDLLRELQRNRQHMAVVVDEYGGTAGIVTLEDLIEEIIGDIQDEFDRTAPELEPAGEDCYTVDGRISLAKLQRTLEIEPPTEETEMETLGGWLLSQETGRPLRIGDTFHYGNARISVQELAGRRVRKARVCIPERATTSSPANDAETIAG